MHTLFDFTHTLDRQHSDSLKWQKYAGQDVIPLWVADMDFLSPPAVIEALHRRVDHGCFGYALPSESLVEAVQAHLQRHYGWSIDASWLVWLPGLVTGLNIACRAVEGHVVTATPVYPPFLSAPVLSGKQLTQVPLSCDEETGWGWDFERFESSLTKDTRLLLLCHPHNPVGRAWRYDELNALAHICEAHDLVVCSDEIHCDLVLDNERKHIPLAALSPAMAQRSITLMAPSKTFNVPGLGCAFAVIPNATLRRQFARVMQGIVPHVNALGYSAAEAAYRDGEPWRQSLLAVLRHNAALVEESVRQLPLLKMRHVEATYLAWIDARGLDVAQPTTFFEQAGVGLSDGADFGSPGWVRLNFGCPTSLLQQALHRMRDVCGVRHG